MGLAYPDPALGDDTVRLRPWARSDVDCIREAATDARIVEATTVPTVFSVAAGQRFIDRQRRRNARGEAVSLAVADAETDEALGLAVLMRRPGAGVVAIGYWVVPRARDRGVARRAVELLSRWALGDGGMTRVEAWVEPGNVASERVLGACGFRREGLLRSFLRLADRRADAIVYARLA